MSSKRKKMPMKKQAAKKAKRKEETDDSDLTDGGEGDAPQPDEVLIAGQLVFFGAVNWDAAGKREFKGVKMVPNLWSPHRFGDWKVRLAVSGCTAAHNVLVDGDGKTYTFGRNPQGQLGLDNTTSTAKPLLVPALEKMNVISAACGRHHTLFLTDTGTVYACGDNKSGQCGVGNLQPQILTPTRINYRGPPIVKIGCGAEFSVILDIKGGLHTFGLPEYGQLGHNTDGKYFKTATKLCYNFQTSPKRVVLYIEKSKDGHVSPVDVTEIVDFSCGPNHTVCIDSRKRAFSWGFGGFGRLGHAEQKDEMVPRLIKCFDTQSRGANMYPKPVQDLAGWNITHIGTSHTSIVISADETCIAWGAAPTFGELGFGDMQKSSTVPKEVTKMQGIKVVGLSMGYWQTLIIASEETPEHKAKVDALKLYEP
ncbi:hypothetical protein HUJ04_005455 [Dendroctonus ponderosae]|nr:hypothetical protein HUJ04_005455 [Dendroctonus ponderosae]KAH1001434.1 hypothetical protein HUJ04_005455 [Dendroctonus ponderosae]